MTVFGSGFLKGWRSIEKNVLFSGTVRICTAPRGSRTGRARLFAGLRVPERVEIAEFEPRTFEPLEPNLCQPDPPELWPPLELWLPLLEPPELWPPPE